MYLGREVEKRGNRTTSLASHTYFYTISKVILCGKRGVTQFIDPICIRQAAEPLGSAELPRFDVAHSTPSA
jgi:hypothetical protein